ncbi:MAG: glycosyltransferase, partial [Candidatus Aminicenantales bacterium]
GVPLVACRTDSMEEIIEDGETGFLVEPYNPRLLKEKICGLLSKKDLLEYVASKAKEWAEEFRWKKRAITFLEYGVFLSGWKNCPYNAHSRNKY